MEGFVRDFFADYGLLALFALMVADNIGVPLPSEVPLLLAGVFVSEGDMAYPAAVAVAAAGSVIGSLIAYGLGRTAGRAVALRWGRFVLISPDDVDRAERWFDKRGDLAVLLCRMVPLARTIISIPAGILEMKIWRFTLFTAIGSTLWCLAVIAAGWILGNRYEGIVGGFSIVGMIVAMIVVAVAAGWWLKRRNAKVRRAG